MARAFWLAPALACVLGCTTEEARFTIVSTRNVEVSRVDLKHGPLERGVSNSDGRFWFLFIPFGSAPSINKAMDGCIEAGKGDFMSSARVKSTWWTIIIFSWESYSVEGDVGNSVGGGAREVAPVPDQPRDKGGVEHN